MVSTVRHIVYKWTRVKGVLATPASEKKEYIRPTLVKPPIIGIPLKTFFFFAILSNSP